MSNTLEIPLLETHGYEFQNLLNAIVDALSEKKAISDCIQALLRAAVSFYGSDRAYVIESCSGSDSGINTQEHCAVGIAARWSILKSKVADIYNRWRNLFCQIENIIIPDVGKMKQQHPKDFICFDDSGVRSMIMVPFCKHQSQGFLCVDNPSKHVMEPLPLRAISYAVAFEFNMLRQFNSCSLQMQAKAIATTPVFVTLLGSFQITSHVGVLGSHDFTLQEQALLTILVMHPHRLFSTIELYEILKLRTKSTNPEKTVSSILYRVRCQMEQIGLKNMIVCQHNEYSLNPYFSIETDTDQFLELYYAIQREEDSTIKMKQCHCALKLYGRPLMETLIDDLRWTIECADMNIKFLNVSHECALIHLRRGEYYIAYEICKYALQIDPQAHELMLLLLKAVKLAKRPGLQFYVKRIAPLLEPDEQEELAVILSETS